MITTTEFQLVDINKLVPYANNARTHNKEQILKLRSSLRELDLSIQSLSTGNTMCWLVTAELKPQKKKVLQKSLVYLLTI